MRRRLLTYILLAAVTGVFLWACQRDRFGHDDPNAVKPTLTVSEAQSIFERQMSQAMPTLTKLSNDRPVGLMPGDFTPLWNKARIGANREMDGADVPINPHYIHVAVFRRLTLEGDTLYRTVDVIQKLVVKQWRDTSDFKAYSYIASIVPTPEYYAKHKNVGKEFRYAGDKGEFSGFVIYHTLEGIPVAIDNYRDGNPTRHDYFPRITKENADSVSRVMELAIGPVAFQSGSLDDFEQNEEVLVTEEVTVKGQGRWYINLHTPSFGGSVGGVQPSPIDYNSNAFINAGGGGAGGSAGYVTTKGNPDRFLPGCNGLENKVKEQTLNLFRIAEKSVPNGMVSRSVSFESFKAAINAKPTVEHAVTLEAYHDISSAKGVALMYLNSETDTHANATISTDRHSVAMLHSHPTSHDSAPSASDILELARSLTDSPDMQAGFVFVGADVYSIQITNPDQAKVFYQNNKNEKPDGSLIDNGFNPNTPAGQFWTQGTRRMSSLQGKVSDTEQYCAAMAYVLSRCNSGIVLSKMGAGDNKFVPYGVRLNAKSQEYYPSKCN